MDATRRDDPMHNTYEETLRKIKEISDLKTLSAGVPSRLLSGESVSAIDHGGEAVTLSVQRDRRVAELEERVAKLSYQLRSYDRYLRMAREDLDISEEALRKAIKYLLEQRGEYKPEFVQWWVNKFMTAAEKEKEPDVE